MGGNVFLGRHSYGSHSTFGTMNDVYVGNYCSIALGVLFDTGLNHNYNNLTTYPFNAIMSDRYSHLNTHPITRGDIHIGNDVWIGRDATIMSGVTVGDGAIIGSKALVTKDVEPYSIVGGVPAKHIRYRFDKKWIDLFLETKWWNWSDESVHEIVPILMSNDFEAYKKHCGGKFVKGNRIAIYTRSMNAELYTMMQSRFSPNFDFIRVSDCHGAQGSLNYLYKCIFNDYDWVINIDEDMFVYDEKRILSLLEHMIDNGIDYCGMSDGGVCKHRMHSPIVVNPFFNIFNAKKIRSALDDVNFVSGFTYSEDMEKFMPKVKKGYVWTNDNYEPYYPFFYWLRVRGFNALYLDSYEDSDEISTVIKNHLGEDIGIHTWYSREFGVDPYHSERIRSAYKLASNYLI